MKQTKIQIGDDEATLFLARQIGMETGCCPLMENPLSKNNKYKGIDTKLIHKYLIREHYHKPTPITTPMPDWNQFEPDNPSLLVKTSRTMGCGSPRKIYSSQSNTRQIMSSQTARTRSFWSNKSKQHKIPQNKNEQIRQNKSLLTNLWKSTKGIKQIKNIRNIEQSLIKPQKTRKKKRTIIRFNKTVKSFQFY